MKKLLLLFLISFLFSCRETWSSVDKRAFYDACTSEANKWAASPEQAKTYCDCVFDRMYKKYPHEDDALEHIAELARDTDLIRCKDDIMKSSNPK